MVVSLFAKLFQKAPKELSLEDLFFAYADVLESGPDIVDARTLPDSKSRIKAALLMKYDAPEAVAARPQIANAYVMLSGFQDLSSEERAGLKDYYAVMSDGPKAGVAEFADGVVRTGGLYQQLLERVQTEANELVAELRQAGVEPNAHL